MKPEALEVLAMVRPVIGVRSSMASPISKADSKIFNLTNAPTPKTESVEVRRRNKNSGLPDEAGSD
jgi:hypothetical protein